MRERLSRSYSRALVGLVGAARRTGIHRRPVVGAAVRRAADPVLRRARPAKVYVNGFEFELDANDDLDLVAHGDYEPVMQEVLRRHLGPGSRYVDGGAHIGFHALAAARIVGSAAPWSRSSPIRRPTASSRATSPATAWTIASAR